MSNKKHIDRIFQESFKDFEAKPNPELWSKIQNKMALQTEQPKTAFPIWMRIISAAAVLVLLITIGSVFFTGSNNPVSSDLETVDTQTKWDNELTNSNNTKVVLEEDATSSNNLEVVDSQNSKTTSNNTSGSNNETIVNTEMNANGNPLASANSEGHLNTNSENQNKAIASSIKNSAVANTGNKNEKNTNSNYNNSSNNSINTKNTNINNNGIASQDNTSDSDNNGLVNQTNTPNTSNSNNTIESKNTVAIQTSEDSRNVSENSGNKTGIATNSTTETVSETTKSDAIAVNQTATNSSNKTTQNTNNNTVALTINSANGSTKTAPKVERAVSTPETDNLLKETSSQNAIAWNAKSSKTPQNEKEKEENLIVGDSLVSESPSIEDAIAQAEETSEKEEDEKLVNRWQVQANIAPVYYNSLGKGSHIDDEFVSSSKSGETNTSYGVNVSYALSKKLAIRSGINSLNLSYDTDNVILYESPTTNIPGTNNPLRNINLAPESQSLSAFSGDNLGFQQINNELFNAAISQRLSYYEVPVELEYKLVNNRFGVHIIGGMSTFFLNDNQVYSEFEEYQTYIGEANNVNSVSFSTNLGIGLNYKFTNKLLFNFEPTFKYQLNGFENTSGNFRPYIIGVYTGFSYKF